MLNLVPFACSRRKVTDLNWELVFISQLLKLSAPRAYPITITSTTISSNEKATSIWICNFTHFAPPTSNTLNRKLSDVMINTYVHPFSIIGQIIDSHIFGHTGKLPFLPSVFKITNILFLPGIDRDNWITSRLGSPTTTLVVWPSGHAQSQHNRRRERLIGRRYGKCGTKLLLNCLPAQM